MLHPIPINSKTAFLKQMPQLSVTVNGQKRLFIKEETRDCIKSNGVQLMQYLQCVIRRKEKREVIRQLYSFTFSHVNVENKPLQIFKKFNSWKKLGRQPLHKRRKMTFTFKFNLYKFLNEFNSRRKAGQ